LFQTSSGYNTNNDDAFLPVSPGGTLSSRDTIAQLRKEFINRPPDPPEVQRPRNNKYLSPERRFTPPKVNILNHKQT
jgi:hypothetical protein